MFAAAALWNRSEVLREDTQTIQRTTAILHEHARKVFDTVELVIGRVDDRTRDLSWEEIASPATSAFLRDLKSPLEQAVSIWITDASGRVRAGSQAWDPAVSLADRDFFAAQRERDAGLFISEPFQGRATRTSSFAASRRRSAADGRFGGTIHVSLSPDYFSRFFDEASPNGPDFAALIRQDGEILARSPVRAANARVAPDSPLMRAIKDRPDGGLVSGVSQVDRRDRVFAYRKVGPYPLYVSFAIDRDVILSRWRSNILAYGIVALLSALTLCGVSWLALRRAQAEQIAVLAMRRESEQRLAAEQRLFQSQKMESLGQLTGGVAHDFNNLLAVVIGNLDLLRKRVTEDERGRRLLENAIQGAQRGAVLTQRLLAYSRTQELAPKVVDVPALVAGMMDLLQRSLGPGVRIKTAFPPELPPVIADPNQLELVLLNLAVNARDAMPDGGTVTLSAHPDEAPGVGKGDLRPGAYIRITVQDTGLGMDPETLARAIEPFFTTKGVGKGTGLGLSMVHGFAVQSGGATRITSSLGSGTSVDVWLPRSSTPALPEAVETREERSHRARTILLVDDDPLVMASTSAMLEDIGHTVLEAASGRAALALLGASPSVDLVIADYAMPGMTGLKLAERLRTDRPELPFLLASGHAELPEQADILVARITKPFRQDELANAIDDVLRRAGASARRDSRPPPPGARRAEARHESQGAQPVDPRNDRAT
ncbi:hybrid sensor histidine kinase/response regulator [Salinarimonas soli]|uniref:hybrid sensor histidine kinase/response regulator n=1 Tax=Salinarimonas soli TaxID=1638099 RepID=UPI001F0B1FC8|nr:hybrid sensor histidine kinase/response regulator [Salinarimonas soli]